MSIGVMSRAKIAQQMLDELERATEKFGEFNGTHEGWAIIKEELDELVMTINYKLWDEVKRNDIDAAIEECIQVGAMAMRFVYDITRYREKIDEYKENP